MERSRPLHSVPFQLFGLLFALLVGNGADTARSAGRGGQDCHRNGTGTGRGGLAAGVAALIALDGRGGSRDCHAQTQDERENKGYKLSHCDFPFSVKM